MKILVTGGAGFIGSAFIRKILDETKFHILNVDKLSYAGNLSNIPYPESDNYKFLELDIANYETISGAIKTFKPTRIINFAAESHVDRSINDSKHFIDTNIIGTYNILEIIRKNPALCATKDFMFHHISTDEVYGDIGFNDKPPSEDSPYNPSSPYSATKASSDMLVKAWHRTYGIPTVISNCTNNYGPYQYPEKLIPVIILNALHKKKIPIYGNGKQIRDWIHVDDHVDGLTKIIEKGKSGNSYNFGGHNQIQNIEVAQKICKILNAEELSANFNYESLIEHVSDRPGHDLRYDLDTSKSMQELGWKPEVDFNDGLRLTVKWFLSNSGWWKDLYR